MPLPVTKIRNLNDITLNWAGVFETNSEVSLPNFKLQICDDLKQWKTVYCGPKIELKVDNLASCTCYDFRIKSNNADDWLYFKAATDDPGPFTSVIHMTRAVRLGKMSVIRKIAIVKPILLNTENKDQKTPLFQAIEAKDLQILNLLLTLGAKVNKPLMYTRRTPLMHAVYKGALQAASVLIDKGAKICSKDINGLTIIHYAVDSNELDNVKFAVGTKLNINGQDNSGWTPLLRAAILQCKQEITDYLIEKGADPTVKDKNGFDYEKHVEITANFRRLR